MTTSGEEGKSSKTVAEAAAAAEGVTIPEGMVLVSKKEHDQLGGQLRTAKKQLSDRETADQAADRTAQVEASAAAGKFDEALGIKDEEARELKVRLRKATLGDVLTDAITGKGYSGEQALALKQLVDKESIEFDVADEPVSTSVAAALDSTVSRFPHIFAGKSQEGDAEEPGKRVPRQAGPASPAAPQAKPEGYISPEDYEATPRAERMTHAFQQRATLSQPFWPTHIHRSDLQQDG